MPVSRRSFTKEFKLKVIQAYESGTSIAELMREFNIHANLVYKWSQEYRNNPSGAFRGSDESTIANQALEKRVSELEQMLGRLTMENDFLKKALKRAEAASINKSQDNGTN
jgi:transposase